MKGFFKSINFKTILKKVVFYPFVLALPFIMFYNQVPFLSKYTMSGENVSLSLQQQIELQYSVKRGAFPQFTPFTAYGRTASALSRGQAYHPLFYIAGKLPGYWNGSALHWNIFLKLLSLGFVQLCLLILLRRLKLNTIFSFIISFITVYNFKMLNFFENGASLENYTGYLLLCTALAFFYMKPSRFVGPASIIISTYLFICGGNPQMLFPGITGVCVTLTIIPFILEKISPLISQNPKHRRAYFMGSILSIFTGILLASAYLLPFYFDFIKTTSPQTLLDSFHSSFIHNSSTEMLHSIFSPLYSDIRLSFGSSPLIILIVLFPILFAIRRKLSLRVLSLWIIFLFMFFICVFFSTPHGFNLMKNFPVAGAFGNPGNMTMVFPFLILLGLAWIFKMGNIKFKLGVREFPFSPFIILPLAAIPLYLIYNIGIKKAKALTGFSPVYQNLPGWVESLSLWLGFLTLVFAVIYFFDFKKSTSTWKKIAGLFLIISVVVQTGIHIRYGVPLIERPSSVTLDTIDRAVTNPNVFFRKIGSEIESIADTEQKRRSIIEPVPAKIYQDYECVPGLQKAYIALAKRNMTRVLVVEATPDQQKSFKPAPWNDTGYDWLVLKENSYNRLLFEARTQVSAFFTLSFPYSPNWKARIDGMEVPVYRANGHMLAIYADPGEHEIEFRYWSKAAFIGMIISCVLFILAGFFFKNITCGPGEKKRVLITWIYLLIPAVIFYIWYKSLYDSENLKTQYQWNTNDFYKGDNLAYGKKARMKTGKGDYYAGQGVDGSHYDYFKTNSGTNNWWQVDLGKPRQLGEVILFDRSTHGKRQLPLDILVSMNGTHFYPVKTVTERGNENPWRIRLEGEIARVVRLQTRSSSALSFNEVEIIPPLRPGNGTPWTEFVKHEVLTGKVLEAVNRIRKGSFSGNAAEVQSILEKNSGLDSGLRNVLVYEALSTALDRNNLTLIKALRTSQYELPFCVTQVEPEKLTGMFLNRGVKSSGDRELLIWDNSMKKIEQIAPALLKVLEIGMFKFEVLKVDKKELVSNYSPDSVKHVKKIEGKASVILKNKEADDKNSRRIQFGFELSKLGMEKIPTGKYIHFIVKASISEGLEQDDRYINCFIISEYLDGKWVSKRVPFTSFASRTHIVSKKISKGASQVLTLIQFHPRNTEDQIVIEDIKILITENPL